VVADRHSVGVPLQGVKELRRVEAPAAARAVPGSGEELVGRRGGQAEGDHSVLVPGVHSDACLSRRVYFVNVVVQASYQ